MSDLTPEELADLKQKVAGCLKQGGSLGDVLADWWTIAPPQTVLRLIEALEGARPDVERQRWCREHIHYFEAEDTHGTGSWTDTPDDGGGFEGVIDYYMEPEPPHD